MSLKTRLLVELCLIFDQILSSKREKLKRFPERVYKGIIKRGVREKERNKKWIQKGKGGIEKLK